jgi:hypothetical protein
MQVHVFHLCDFNLLLWRPFFLDAVVHTYLRPSGFVPNNEIGRHDPRLSTMCGDEGLDVIFVDLCWGLSAIIHNHVVIYVSLKAFL